MDEHASSSPCIRANSKLVCNGFWNLKVTHHALVMNGWVFFFAHQMLNAKVLCHIAYVNLEFFLVIVFNHVSLHLNWKVHDIIGSCFFGIVCTSFHLSFNDVFPFFLNILLCNCDHPNPTIWVKLKLQCFSIKEYRKGGLLGFLWTSII